MTILSAGEFQMIQLLARNPSLLEAIGSDGWIFMALETIISLLIIGRTENIHLQDDITLKLRRTIKHDRHHCPVVYVCTHMQQRRLGILIF